jgi:hypothetical protein
MNTSPRAPLFLPSCHSSALASCKSRGYRFPSRRNQGDRICRENSYRCPGGCSRSIQNFPADPIRPKVVHHPPEYRIRPVRQISYMHTPMSDGFDIQMSGCALFDVPGYVYVHVCVCVDTCVCIRRMRRHWLLSFIVVVGPAVRESGGSMFVVVIMIKVGQSTGRTGDSSEDVGRDGSVGNRKFKCGDCWLIVYRSFIAVYCR